MRREHRNPLGNALTAVVRSVTGRVRRWRGRPPEEAGIREPRRPRPTLPAGAIALAEPRAASWFRLTWRRGTDRP